MENREAIEALRDLLDTTREYPHLDGMTMFGEALTLAIDALEKQTVDKCCETCKHRNHTAWERPCNGCYLANDYEDCYEAEEDNE